MRGSAAALDLLAKADEVDRVLSDNKSEVKKWYRRKGRGAEYLVGAPE